MGETTYPPVFFVSYARADAEYEPDREDLSKFVEDLSARVARKLPTPREGVRFFDSSSIETGEVWSQELVDALMKSRVGVALYTPNYFTRRWCGKEFQAFLDRVQSAQGSSGIVPVLWMKCTTLPSAVDKFQYKDAAFPAEYAQVGMQQLLRLKAVYADKYELALEAVADRIVAAAAPPHSLRPMTELDVDTLRSAWEQSAQARSHSHKEGSVSKTCFVFVSRQGWDWRPYSATDPTVGAVAQQISGALGLRYEEITCDAALKDKLRETHESKVPTVLFADPGSLQDNAYAKPLQEYDTQFLLNCAALVPWDEAAKQTGDNDTRWVYLRTKVCRQKTEAPPPYHEWRSIFSQADLEAKTRITIEQIRSRLMKQLMSEPDAGTPSAPRKATDPVASDVAAALGIRTDTPAQLEGPKR
jgi:hypothetical protein